MSPEPQTRQRPGGDRGIVLNLAGSTTSRGQGNTEVKRAADSSRYRRFVIDAARRAAGYFRCHDVRWAGHVPSEAEVALEIDAMCDDLLLRERDHWHESGGLRVSVTCSEDGAELECWVRVASLAAQ